ncbi:CBM96 family carbohydrate-binding protein [Thalassotalea sp. PLHSN55]|uniref:CBM96 family carbohydrate-binding protein n=1 Tax=Thalassotalea sp. PLHSN55 TaxID=3435888 RepID=UPI003F865E3B
MYLNAKKLALAAITTFSFVVQAAPIHFALGKSGDPTNSGADPQWQIANTGSYKKITDPLLSSYLINVEQQDVTINLFTDSENAKSLMLNKVSGISIDGNNKGDINGEEVLNISFDQDVYVNAIYLENLNNATQVDFNIADQGWQAITEVSSGEIHAKLLANELLQVKLHNANNDEQFKLAALDISLSAPESHAPKGNFIRLRPLQNPGYDKLLGNFWGMEGKTAQDVFKIIAETQPTELERFISGPFDLTGSVPVDEGEPEMSIGEFLNTVTELCDCIFTPRVSLDYYKKSNAWSTEYPDNTFWAVVDNLYHLPLDKPIRKMSIDNWGAFSSNYDDEEINQLLIRLDSMGIEVATNYIGGNPNSYDIVTTGAFGVDPTTFLPKIAAHKALALNESIKDLILYLDFNSPAEEFSQLPSDEQADLFVEIGQQQDIYGFTFVWPVHNADWWQLESTFTSANGPYQGKSLYQVLLEQLDATPAHTPQPLDGAQGVSTQQTLSWQHGLQSQSYQVYLGDSENNLQLVCTTTTPECTVDTLENNRHYVWRVDNISAQGEVIGNVWQFSTALELTYIPSQDASVVENKPTENKGLITNLRLKEKAGEDNLAYVDFILDDEIANVNKATLKVYLQSEINSPDTTLLISAAQAGSWQESSLNWQNQPGINQQISSINNLSQGWLEVDITDFVKQRTTNEISLVLSATSSTLLKLASRETSFAPMLVIN